MIDVSMVSVLNLDKLYKICIDKQNNSEEFVPMFKNYLYMLYNNINISMQINNLNIYEAYMLKSFATSVGQFSNMHVDYSDIDYTPSERNLIELYRTISEDDKIKNINKSDFPYYYGPCKFIKLDTWATFTGFQLINLLGDPTDFFLKLSAGACSTSDDDGRLFFKPEYILNDSAVGSFIANTFYTKFGSFIINSFVSNDIYSSKGIHDYFAIDHKELDTHTNKFNIRIASIINPYLKVNISNGLDMMNNDIEEFKNNAPSFVKNNILDNTSVEFYICSTFDTLIDISNNIPISMITSQEHPIDILINNPDAYEFNSMTISKDYDESLESLGKAVIKDTISLVQSTNTIEKKNWNSLSSAIFLNSKVSFTIQVSLKDINLYINTALNNNTGMKKATREILQYILKASVAIYNKIK